MRKLVAVLLACATVPAAADPVADALAALEGTVVDISGAYRPGLGQEAFVFLDEGGNYPVQLATPPSVIRDFEACSAGSFQDLCTFDASAEISFQGSMVLLLIFDVQNLVVPN